MKRSYIPLFLIISVLAVTVCSSSAAGDKDIDSILSSAESLFKMMKERNYTRIWFFLSNASRNAIIEDTYRNMVSNSKEKGKGMIFSREQIRDNFGSGGAIARVYWDSYIDAFNPDMVLEQSKWEMGKVSKDKAEINIIYKKATRPAIIQMYKEDDIWRVGLAETFKSAKR